MDLADSLPLDLPENLVVAPSCQANNNDANNYQLTPRFSELKGIYRNFLLSNSSLKLA